MRSRRRRINSGSETGMGGQLLSLSLFVMLLAFFIILNAISSYESAKVDPVLKSLESAFASKISEADNTLPSVSESVQKSLNEGGTLDRLQSLFVAQIPAHEVTINRSTGTMHVTLPLDDFENAVMAIGREESVKTDGGEEKLLKGFFLPALVALMKDDMAGKPYRMDIVLNTDSDPAQMVNQNPKKIGQIRERISAIALKIENGGLPEKFMSVGLKKGQPETVDLFFQPHIPYNPLEGSDGE